MNNDKPIQRKRWPEMTVEERVHHTLLNQRKHVEEIDPGDQFLTHHNFVHDPVNYHIVDLQRHFLRMLELIVEDPKFTPAPVKYEGGMYCPTCHTSMRPATLTKPCGSLGEDIDNPSF